MAANRPAGAVEESVNPETWLEEHGDFLFRYTWSGLRDRYTKK
jgi:hypothetical protein